MVDATAILQRNLRALGIVDPDVARRICLPVDDSHVRFDAQGRAQYRLHQTFVPVEISRPELVQSVAGAGKRDEVFLFGIGFGEQLRLLLDRVPSPHVTVWDRDPWLVRLALMRHDYTRWIQSRRLRFSLCADLLDELPTVDDRTVICHPFFRQVYANEHRLLSAGMGDRRALVCAGALFVDDLSHALHGAGYSLFTLDIARLSNEELAAIVQRVDPAFIAAINYTYGLAEFCHLHRRKLLCWEIDPATETVQWCDAPTDHVRIFTYRRANIAEYQAAGFAQVEYLPLATNTSRRSPLRLPDGEARRYAAPVSFVGSSMAQHAESFRAQFITHYAAYCGNTPESIAEGARILDEVLADQAKDVTRYIVPVSLDERCPGLRDACHTRPSPHDPVRLAGELAAADKRLHYVSALGRFGIHVWGDEAWRHAERSGARYRGPAGHFLELTKIYGASVINVDIGRLYQPDIVTMRVFDVLACGGFVIAEYSPALAELFVIGEEVEAYATLDELCEKVAYYLDRPAARRQIAARGRERVCRDHTIALRLRHMLNCLGESACPTAVGVLDRAPL